MSGSKRRASHPPKNYFVTSLLLLNANSLLLALAGASVGAGALATDGKPALVADAAVAVDGSEALELRLALTAEIAFDHDRLCLDHLRDLDELVFSKLTGADIRINSGVLKNTARRRAADAEHVCEGSFDALLVGDFDA